MENLNTKIKEAYVIKLSLEEIEADMQKLKENKASLEKKLEEINTELLKAMIENKQEEIETDNHIFANYFVKNEFSYGDEKALLKYLQEHNLLEYVNTKTTTTISINKNNLKKDLKVKQDLKESLKDYVGDRKTEYVVITNEENHKKMLEHIEENK